MAAGLRTTAAPGWVLTIAGVVAGISVLVVRWMVGNPTAWWMNKWESWLVTPPEVQNAGTEHLVPELLRFLESIAPVMTGVVISGFLLLVILTLFLARWGQALLDNPGGFGEEFRDLALPKGAAYTATLIALAIMFSSGSLKDIAAEFAMLLLVLYVVHGLAIVHGLVKILSAAKGWLVLLYLVLTLTPFSSFLLLMLAMAGLSDSWVGYRRRVHNRVS